MLRIQHFPSTFSAPSESHSHSVIHQYVFNVSLVLGFARQFSRIKLMHVSAETLQVQKSSPAQFDSWMSDCVAAATWISRTPASWSGFITTLTPRGEAGWCLLLQAVYYYSAVYFMLLSVMWRRGASRWEQRCKDGVASSIFLLREAPDRSAFFKKWLLLLLFAITPPSSLSLLLGQQQPVQVNSKASAGGPARESHFSSARTPADRASLQWRRTPRCRGMFTESIKY